jgi:hypothetical protein
MSMPKVVLGSDAGFATSDVREFHQVLGNLVPQINADYRYIQKKSNCYQVLVSQWLIPQISSVV